MTVVKRTMSHCISLAAATVGSAVAKTLRAVTASTRSVPRRVSRTGAVNAKLGVVMGSTVACYLKMRARHRVCESRININEMANPL